MKQYYLPINGCFSVDGFYLDTNKRIIPKKYNFNWLEKVTMEKEINIIGDFEIMKFKSETGFSILKIINIINDVMVKETGKKIDQYTDFQNKTKEWENELNDEINCDGALIGFEYDDETNNVYPRYDS